MGQKAREGDESRIVHPVKYMKLEDVKQLVRENSWAENPLEKRVEKPWVDTMQKGINTWSVTMIKKTFNLFCFGDTLMKSRDAHADESDARCCQGCGAVRLGPLWDCHLVAPVWSQASYWLNGEPLRSSCHVSTQPAAWHRGPSHDVRVGHRQTCPSEAAAPGVDTAPRGKMTRCSSAGDGTHPGLRAPDGTHAAVRIHKWDQTQD